MLQRVIVMSAQHFHVSDPKANTLGGGEDFGERGRVDARKNICADKRPCCAWRRQTADAVDECVAVFSQQFADLAEVFSEMTDTDMLHHANGDHAIKAAGELTVVNLVEFHLLAHSSRLRTLARHADLRGRDVNGCDTRARELGQVNRERPPAGADLGDRHTWTEVQFGRDLLKLVQLRLFDRVVCGVLKECT